MEAREGAETVWLSENPTPKLEKIIGERHFSPVDPEYRRFFTKQSLLGGQLLHQEYREVSRVTRVSRKEAGLLEPGDLERRLRTTGTDRIVIEENPAEDERFMFIYRAKYRVRPEEPEPTPYF